MATADISTCRSYLDGLGQEDLLRVTKEVDPVCEATGILKAMENGPALLFENVKGYPGQRIMCNLFSREDRVARMFGVAETKDLKHRGAAALRRQIAPREVANAPSQELVTTKDIDVLSMLPVCKYTETDPGRILGGGVTLLSGPDIGTCASYKRVHFRGKDWGSMAFIPSSHLEHWSIDRKRKGQKLPLTINICPPPAVMAVAAGGGLGWAIPAGSDELGFAGGLQGSPVNVCKAKTVDALAIADAEWVIEGYIDTSQTVWESDEAERHGDNKRELFPEWHGHEGRAERTYKFCVTGVTRRKDNPIFELWLAHSLELPIIRRLINDGPIFEFLDRLSPGLVTDINALDGMKSFGLVIQVRKRARRDDAVVRNLILSAFSMNPRLRNVFVVDDDVDIYDAEDVMWALHTRLDPRDNMIVIPRPTSEVRDGPLSPVGRVGFDLTAPKQFQNLFWRGQYPRVDLRKWFTDEQIAAVQARQSPYARVLARKAV
ncbi:MAG: hypothetical protein ABS43_31370 [Bordetella sp. SCN 67-23]|nr:MAG: hypothetical protein ABS43_31370 [Bordetella sp. SCN 67-23]